VCNCIAARKSICILETLPGWIPQRLASCTTGFFVRLDTSVYSVSCHGLF
jgi:hypothetical protein